MLLILCVSGAGSGLLPWHAAQAGVATHEAGRPETRRVALVIGNAAYREDPLRNPVNDARAMSDMLASLGFDVLRHENASRQRMEEALLEFRRRLNGGGVGLFYFAGHGIQVADTTLLTPVDADRRAPARLLTQGIDLHTVLKSMSDARPGMLNLVILDTCLNNPFRTGNAGIPEAPEQTLIALATAPGSFAADGNRHGVYTAALLKALAVSGRDVTDVFSRAAAAVRETSRRQQAPQISSALPDGFRFAMTTQTGALPSPPASSQVETVLAQKYRAILPKDSAEQYELAFWDSIKDSNHASDYEAYLKAYPNGRFAALARARIERLRAAQPKAETPKEAPRPAPATKAPERPRPAPAAREAPEQARPAPAPKEPPPQARPAPAAPPATARSSGGATSEVKDCPACPALIALPPGAFTMGSNTSDPSEKPAHHVSVAAPFAIGKHEVTVEQWNACVEGGGCPPLPNGARQAGNMPVRDVSWDDVQQYLKWLGKVAGKPYRLPTEAEWEYAARGGTSTRFWWGEQMRPGNANCKDCGEPWSAEGPAPVGSFAANPFGLHDINGSVWEWVSDCWHNSYKGAPGDGRAWDTPNCRERVIRGGSWREGASYMPSSTRFKYAASVRNSQNGFRVARDVK